MKIWIWLLYVVCTCALASEKTTLSVMTYNLRTANDNPGEEWSSRRHLVTKCIKGVSPDIIGTQEGLSWQLGHIADALPKYGWIGLGRQGKDQDEHMAIFYRKARLQPIEHGHFWLSDAPEVVGSATWGNIFPRMVTWVRFRDKKSGQKFYVFNTHLDHEVSLARLKSAELISKRISMLDPHIPVLLIGDFNCDAVTSKVYKLLVKEKGFTDIWSSAATKKGGAHGTFNGFGKFSLGNARIDWILARGHVQINSAEVIETIYNGLYPSDHFPLLAKLKIRGP